MNMNNVGVKTLAFQRPAPRTSSSSSSGPMSSRLTPSSRYTQSSPSTTSSTTSRRASSATYSSSSSSIASGGVSTTVYERTRECGEILRTYTVGKLLGKGGFAKVYEFVDTSTGKLSAAKVIDKNSLKKEKMKQKLLTEIKIHKSMRHRNIVNFEHFFNDEKNVYIVLEVCHCHSMLELLKKKQRLNEAEAKFLMYQILTGVQYMHSNLVIHRDLKLGNFFLTENMEVKIGDFGLAAQLEFDGQRKQTICGTPNYIAPEILHQMGHSYEVDVWSIGVILFTMLVGTPPFETDDVKKTYRKIKANIYSFPDEIYVSECAKNLIRRILNPDPSQRPSVREIMNDKFFTMAQQTQCPPSLRQYAQENASVPPLSRNIQLEQRSSPLATRSPFQTITNVRPDKTGLTSPSPAKKSFPKATYAPYTRTSTTPNKYVPSTRPATGLTSSAKRFAADGFDSHLPSARAMTPSPQSVRSSPTAKDDLVTRPFSAQATARTNNRSSAPTTDDDVANLTSMHDNLTHSLQRAIPMDRIINTPNTVPSNIVAPVIERPVMEDIEMEDIEMEDIEIEDDDAEIRDPEAWVTQWADFSGKYGLAYKLNNGYVGAHYNDATKLVWKVESSTIDYMERKKTSTGSYDERQTFGSSNTPEFLNKKITLIKYFKQYLENEQKNKEKGSGDCGSCGFTGQTLANKSNDDVYVKRWLRTRHAVIFRLSNKIIQVSFFDHTEIILSSEARLVTYTDHDGKRRTYSLKTVMKDPQPDLAKRLKYTKDILYQLISKQGTSS